MEEKILEAIVAAIYAWLTVWLIVWLIPILKTSYGININIPVGICEWIHSYGLSVRKVLFIAITLFYWATDMYKYIGKKILYIIGLAGLAYLLFKWGAIIYVFCHIFSWFAG